VDAGIFFFSASDDALYSDLEITNRRVNAAIQPAMIGRQFAFGDGWLLYPLFGNCNDFAVSKRHELLRAGWPSSALLLAEVALKTGEHHLVLIAMARGNSFVLDNLKQHVVPLSDVVDYRWIKIETPENPESWASVNFGK